MNSSQVGRNVLQTLSECEVLMNNEGSYKAYRTVLRNSDPPCIPYLYKIHIDQLLHYDAHMSGGDMMLTMFLLFFQ